MTARGHRLAYWRKRTLDITTVQMKVRRRLEPVTGNLSRCRNLKRHDMGDKIILTVLNRGWNAQ
jgi:hypothetical protein